ncbi:Hypothetical protein FKW44_017058 [Caligus rogercresseyi]|uniref:Uncharacterized protein n=1 Tax=Caligus rogercresseyi TaxID=217165 RepID=A0A7T8H2M8_CALRO|nr:Hypothetical protein FKW44_017058 [Caligus rogercresseyi]
MTVLHAAEARWAQAATRSQPTARTYAARLWAQRPQPHIKRSLDCDCPIRTLRSI